MALIAGIYEALNRQTPNILEPYDRMRAAVAIVLEESRGNLHVLFIERAINEHDYWSGHISFPGGRLDEADATPKDAAERETWEELGLDLTGSRYLGRLDDLALGGMRLVISPFVYAVDRRPELRPDYREVASAFWFPVHELANPDRRTEVRYPLRTGIKRFPAVRLLDNQGQPLWGITYRLLRNLGRLVRKNKTGAWP